MATYSFPDVQCSIEGPGAAFSLSDNSSAEEGITIEPTGEKNTMTVGAGGGVMHSLHADKSGKVTVRYLKTSAINQQLAQAYASQTSTSANHGQNNITLNDPNRGDHIVCQQVAFAKAPTLVFAKEGNVNEWEFHAGIIDRILGNGAPALS